MKLRTRPRLLRYIRFQLEFGPYTRLGWPRAHHHGHWRQSHRFPRLSRRMLPWERRKDRWATRNYDAVVATYDPGIRYREGRC